MSVSIFKTTGETTITFQWAAIAQEVFLTPERKCQKCTAVGFRKTLAKNLVPATTTDMKTGQ